MCIDKCTCVGQESVVTYLSGLTATKYEMSLYFFLYTNYHNTSFHQCICPKLPLFTVFLAVSFRGQQLTHTPGKPLIFLEGSLFTATDGTARKFRCSPLKCPLWLYGGNSALFVPSAQLQRTVTFVKSLGELGNKLSAALKTADYWCWKWPS